LLQGRKAVAKLEPNQLSPFGVDVVLTSTRNLDSGAASEIRDLFQRDGLLLVRGLQLSHQEQIEFCRIIGPVCESPFENFLVSNVAKDAHLGARELLWHNDVPYLPLPYLGASLHALQVDPGAVGTRFASGFRAYERLPQQLRDRVAGMNALQVRERVWDRPNRLTDLEPGDICTVHPVVRTQGKTGRPYLFVNQDMTACIIGLSDSDSQALLDELYSYFYVEEDVYEHSWAEGDLVVWDNLAVQHSRGRVGEGARTLQRVSITELGYAQQYPTDTGIYNSLHNEALVAAEA
jgi:taurine dioxygenase